MNATLSYLRLLVRLNWSPFRDKPGPALFFAFGMFAQDLLFFAGWIIIFSAVGSVRGWNLPEIFLLYGVICISYGLGFVCTNGIRQLGNKIADGDIDIFLLRPRDPLPSLFITRCNPGGVGDILCGLLFLIFGAQLTWMQIPLAVIAAILSSLLFEAMKLIFYSLNFFVAGGSKFGDYLTDVLYYLTTVPQLGQGILVKTMLFTILPAGFLVGLPMRLVRQESPSLLVLLALITGLYCVVATAIFHRGVARYKRVGPA